MSDRIDQLTAAISREEVLEFSYPGTHAGAGKPYISRRTISPYEVREAENGNEVLVGYDHDREEIRQFSIDKVSVVTPADDTYIQPEED